MLLQFFLSFFLSFFRSFFHSFFSVFIPIRPDHLFDLDLSGWSPERREGRREGGREGGRGGGGGSRTCSARLVEATAADSSLGTVLFPLINLGSLVPVSG